MNLADQFTAYFNEELTAAIVAAAKRHEDETEATFEAIGMPHKRKEMGSDPFRFALAECIARQCITKPDYAIDHEINPEALPAIKQWVKDFAELEKYDGDIDFLATLAGAYSEFLS